MKSEYFVLLPNDISCSLQSFAAIALKTKKLCNYGATLIVHDLPPSGLLADSQ